MPILPNMRARQVSVSKGFDGFDSGSEYIVSSDTESECTGSESHEPELDGFTEVCSEIDVPDLTDSGEAQEIEDQIREFAHNASKLTLDDYDDEDSLFDGNTFPVEHYRRGLREMDESAYDRKEYAEKTEEAIARTHARWSQYVSMSLLESKEADARAV